MENEVKDVHILAWTAGKGWGIKREGSDKVIKYYKTKVEGLEAIMKMSENQKTRVVIHLKNGKFQKFDNAMRALASAKENPDD